MGNGANNLFGKYTKLVQSEAIGVAGILVAAKATGTFSWWDLGVVVLMGVGTYSGDNTPIK
jgi:hypothetical protein